MDEDQGSSRIFACPQCPKSNYLFDYTHTFIPKVLTYKMVYYYCCYYDYSFCHSF